MKPIIGKKDIADFPEFKLTDLEVKIDTGAYTSSIHCHEIEVETSEEESVLNVIFLDPTHPKFTGEEFHFRSFQLKDVKSSNGTVEQRALIKSKIILFGKSFPIQFTLTDRGDMKFPVLLGRKLLNKRFLVDTTRFDVSYEHKIKKDNL